MSTSNIGRTEVVVMPVRFTEHLPQMREFLSLIGFSPKVSRPERWVTMAGSAGMVALHEAAISGSGSGETELSFEVADIDALAAQYIEAGFVDVEIYDEAYGRVLRVQDHEGKQLSFDQPSDDLYGYHLDDPRPEHGIISMPLHFVPPTGPIARLLSAAGFVRLDEGDDEWWRVWRSTGGGLIALHPPTDDAPPGSTRLGFRTQEPLSELAKRLTAAGHAGVTLADEYGGELTVTDLDGQKVFIAPAPQNPPS